MAAPAIVDLPPDVLPRIALFLDLHDVLSVRATCRKLADAANDDLRLWRVLCDKQYGQQTAVDRWRAQPASSCLKSYRSVYQLLHQHAPLVGLWAGSDPGPRGTLFYFRWGDGCVEGLQVKAHSQHPEPEFKDFLCLGPAHPSNSMSIITNSRRHCILTVTPIASPTFDEATTQIAGASMSSPNHHLQGSSPPQHSFPREYMNFTQAFVARRRGRRQGSGPPGPTHHQLIDVPLSRPTRQHPLAGLWKGMYGPHGLELLSIGYNTEGRSAKIEATKVLGDPNIPANKVTWWADAAPLQPLDPWEVQQQVAGLVVPPAGGAQHLRASGDLVAVHRGQGQVAGAGYTGPSWVEGRLWVYSSGDVEFAWLGPFMFVVRLTRVELPLLGPGLGGGQQL